MRTYYLHFSSQEEKEGKDGWNYHHSRLESTERKGFWACTHIGFLRSMGHQSHRRMCTRGGQTRGNWWKARVSPLRGEKSPSWTQWGPHLTAGRVLGMSAGGSGFQINSLARLKLKIERKWTQQRHCKTGFEKTGTKFYFIHNFAKQNF